uniref:(northern house mosquito) hypothetical protein n=1 Tax=Culex pipiens TaxID=7175 RepID=A0A8D8H3A4_CULPI
MLVGTAFVAVLETRTECNHHRVFLSICQESNHDSSEFTVISGDESIFVKIEMNDRSRRLLTSQFFESWSRLVLFWISSESHTWRRSLHQQRSGRNGESFPRRHFP